MKHSRNKKGQFTIVAALLVAIVLVTAIVTTYSILRYTPIQERPQFLSASEEMKSGLRGSLEFTVGYYGSVLQVTGNTTYARSLAEDYLQNSLANLVNAYPKWSPSFHINHSQVSVSWFNRTSFSRGFINATYSLLGIGVSGMQYAASAGLDVTVNPSNTSSVLVNVTRDGTSSYPGLKRDNFFFYNYSYTQSTWKLTNTGLSVNSVTSSETSSVYNITVPSSIDASSYILQVVDLRGIMVAASTFSSYTYTFTWNQPLYSSLSQDTIVVEALQNGTLKWLGQKLDLTNTGKPIPPIPTKAFHINQTVNGVNREVSFQIEDWGSNYQVALGLTSNATVFNSRQMLVFLVNHNVEKVVLWWDGRDIANQTSYAYMNIHFTDDDPKSRLLTNGMLELAFSSSGFTATSSIVNSSVTSTARFLRVNDEDPDYGADPAYVIHHGIVRDIVQQEAEWKDGGAYNCPDLYSQIILTLPANATYYTYALRTIFADTSQSRTIDDLSVLQLNVDTGQPLTENGTNGGFPITSSATGLYYNFTGFPTGWKHHWSEFITNTDSGGGVMFTSDANKILYAFDNETAKMGAINVDGSAQKIELSPIAQLQTSFNTTFDATWIGAVVTFDDTDPIHSTNSNIGLWVMVESPPSVSLS